MEAIKVEVVATADNYGQDLAGRDLKERFDQRVDELVVSVRRIASEIQSRLDVDSFTERQKNWPVSRVELTFGLNLEAEAGVVISRASAACAFGVTLTFERRT